MYKSLHVGEVSKQLLFDPLTWDWQQKSWRTFDEWLDLCILLPIQAQQLMQHCIRYSLLEIVRRTDRVIDQKFNCCKFCLHIGAICKFSDIRKDTWIILNGSMSRHTEWLNEGCTTSVFFMYSFPYLMTLMVHADKFATSIRIGLFKLRHWGRTYLWHCMRPHLRLSYNWPRWTAIEPTCEEASSLWIWHPWACEEFGHSE